MMRESIIFLMYGNEKIGQCVITIDKPWLQKSKGGIIFVLCGNYMVSDMQTSNTILREMQGQITIFVLLKGDLMKVEKYFLANTTSVRYYILKNILKNTKYFRGRVCIKPVSSVLHTFVNI